MPNYSRPATINYLVLIVTNRQVNIALIFVSFFFLALWLFCIVEVEREIADVLTRTTERVLRLVGDVVAGVA